MIDFSYLSAHFKSSTFFFILSMTFLHHQEELEVLVLEQDPGEEPAGHDEQDLLQGAHSHRCQGGFIFV